MKLTKLMVHPNANIASPIMSTGAAFKQRHRSDSGARQVNKQA
jgi:hypothetical protein